LEGLEISEVNYSRIEIDNRYDSEYFKQVFLKAESYLNSKEHFNLGSKYKVTDGEHGSVVIQNSGIKYLTAENIKKGYVDISKVRFVDEEVDKRNARARVNIGDILISIKGTLGEIAVAEEWLLPANMNRDVAIIKPLTKEFPSEYVALFMMSEYGALQSLRGGSGGVQQMITLERLRKFVIPFFSNDFSELTKILYNKAKNCRIESQDKYKQAEILLLETLGLKDFEPSKEPVNIKSFKESFGSSGRLDAEYYQPKYEVITKAIKNYENGYADFDYFIDNYSTGFPYKSDSYIAEGGIPLIRINNICNGILDISNAIQIPKSDIDLSPNDVAVENDILISMSGSIGNSCKIPKGVKAVINQRIMRITPKDFDNEVLPLVINSLIGQYQLNRIGTGGVQTNISSPDIRKILIPKLIEKVQQDLSGKIKESFHLKKQSEQLLELAKIAVEKAIEENEEKATNYINSTLTELKITINHE
jgi:hypothetical protein